MTLLIIGFGGLPDNVVNGQETDAALKKLQGTWQAVASEEVGEKLPKDRFEKSKLLIKGDKFKIQEGDSGGVEGTFKIDPTRKPMTFECRISDFFGKPARTLGIYKLEGDTLSTGTEYFK